MLMRTVLFCMKWRKAIHSYLTTPGRLRWKPQLMKRNVRIKLFAVLQHAYCSRRGRYVEVQGKDTVLSITVATEAEYTVRAPRTGGWIRMRNVAP